MRAFEYASATTVEQAVSLLGKTDGEALILAGGTDLLSLMKDDVVAPQRLVNVKGIAALRGITVAARGGLRIGALVTIQELIDHPQMRRSYPALVEAADGISSPQIRNVGTVGGDLCQRPRCWYYRAGFGLLAKDESGNSLVVSGDNRYHAILGNDGPSYFVNPSSLAPALIALNSRVGIRGPKGTREVPAEKFFVAPSADGAREYDLKFNEVVTEIVIPPAGAAKNATYEVRQREALDWPLATASVVLAIKAGVVSSARIVMGHVAPTPWRSLEAEKAIEGKPVNDDTAQAAGNAAVEKARPLSRNAYKVQLARVAVKRALLAAAGGGAK